MKHNAHTIQSFHNGVRQYLDCDFYTNIVLDSASLMTKIRLALFSKDKDLRKLAKASMKDYPDKSPDYGTDPGCACDVSVVRKYVRDVARTRNNGKPLSVSPYEDGYYYPSCNVFPGLRNLLASIVGNGGLSELKLYIELNEHVISKYVKFREFKDLGTNREAAVDMFWHALDNDIQLLTESILKSELTSLLAQPLPKELKLFCNRPKQPWKNGFDDLLYSEEDILYISKPDEGKIQDWQDRAAAADACAMNQLGVVQILYPGIDTGDSPSNWFEKAAKKGYGPAKYNHASYLSAEENYDRRDVNHELLEAYKQGVYPAMYTLCYLSLIKLVSGSPLKHLMIEMLEKNATVDNLSKLFLAQAYYRGIFVEKDDKKAFEYAYMIAHFSEMSCAYQFRLGHMYMDGIGTERNPEKALKWYRKALDNPLCPEEYRMKAEQDISEINRLNQITKDN